MKFLNSITKGKNKTIKIVAVVAIIGAAVYFGPKLLKNRSSGRVPMVAPVAPGPIPVPTSPITSITTPTGGATPMYTPTGAFRANARVGISPLRQRVLT